ncbi:Mut7-C RNAse domain-containing protein [Oceanispirochaeta sp.]|jgi:uncharacterized protein with PIN domain|uniref:Mut7-C RNAse domain-containing protein n=1 Tax=Oceanispirochaeta sp. TaxID=2035350 RepID=UPI00345D7E58
MNEKNTITIRFYEELNDFLKKFPLKEDIQFSYHGNRSVKDLIEQLKIQIPPGVKEWCHEYSFSSECRRVYWKGSHCNILVQQIGQKIN